MANDKTIFISGSPVISEKGIPLHKKKTDTIRNNTGASANIIDVSGINYPRRYIDYSWLKAASETYNVSPDIKDYVVIPIPIITSDVPNRNYQAFELNDLVKFDSMTGRMLYQTFIGKPTFINHANSILVEARGVNLDVSLLPIKRYNLAKTMILSAFDRNKDRDLVKDILNGRNGYSMGALAEHFECSMCAGVIGPAVKRTCTCFGTDYTDLRTLGSVANGKLHYHIAKNFRFIEVSSVDSPADVTAISDTIL